MTAAMTCTEARVRMLDVRRGRAANANEADAVRAHLATCEACRAADEADAELSRVLGRLPRHDATNALRRTIEGARAPEERRRQARRAAWLPAAVGVGLAAAAAVAITIGTAGVVRSSDRSDAMFAEAVNDHLRVLYSEHPIEIESGGIHQVKPWFAGRLDFAPVVPFAGDADFPLRGGSVAYFLDRKAATFVYARRLHTITLFVFRADGLPWPTTGAEPLGRARVWSRTSRGFHELLWRDGDLGYALVSDVAEPDLRDLAQRIVAPP